MGARRAILLAALHLVGGGVLSVLVAAACCAWPNTLSTTHGGSLRQFYGRTWVDITVDPRQAPDPRHAERRARLLQQMTESDGNRSQPQDFTTFASRSFGREVETGCLRDLDFSSRINAWLCHLTAGWPMPCLESTSIPGEVFGDPVVHAVRLPEWVRPTLDRGDLAAGLLPLRVIPLGLAADAAFYGLALAALTQSPRAMRALRRRKNHCPTCGYDLRGLAAASPCPECGTPAGVAP